MESHAFEPICGILEAILIPLLFMVRVTLSGMGGWSKIGRVRIAPPHRNRPDQGKGVNQPMFPAALSERLDALIDDLIMDGGVESASLASILLAAKDAVKSDYVVTLSRRVWVANNDLKASDARDAGRPGPTGGGPPSPRPSCHPS